MISVIRQYSRTGQTTSSRTGDDGTFQAGMPGNRFADNGDGTISDLSCNPPLVWVKQPELIIPGAAGVHATNQVQAVRGNWSTGIAYAAADLVYDSVGAAYYVCAVGHTSGGVSFATDVAAHPTYWRVSVWSTIDTKSVTSWSKGSTTTLTVGSSHDYVVGSLVSIVGVTYNTGTASLVNGNRIVTAIAASTITVAVNTSSEGTPDNSAGTVLGAYPASMTWNNAIDNCYNLSTAGFDDFRLPNLIEFASIVNHGVSARPYCYSQFAGWRELLANQSTTNFHWTSTTLATATSYAFSWEPGNVRFVGLTAKTSAYLVHPVRGGLTLI